MLVAAELSHSGFCITETRSGSLRFELGRQRCRRGMLGLVAAGQVARSLGGFVRRRGTPPEYLLSPRARFVFHIGLPRRLATLST
jgi:hypothetical protein